MSLTIENNIILRLGQVVSVDDEYGAGRIKVRLTEDKFDKEVPYAYPLLPYMLHILPKVGEAVFVICSDIKSTNSTRFYIGPLIHQPQFVNYDSFPNSTSLMKGFNQTTLPSYKRDPDANGCYPKKDEIGILSRKDSDLIFSDNDVRLRCGVHLTDKNDELKSVFNKQTPTFIKLKKHDKNFSNNTNTTATIVSENINLISTVGSPEFNLIDSNESISDADMANIIENAHQLPYGDILLNFLKLFLKTFNNHTHAYSGLPPVPDINFETLNNFDTNTILSKNVKIN